MPKVLDFNDSTTIASAGSELADSSFSVSAFSKR